MHKNYDQSMIIKKHEAQAYEPSSQAHVLGSQAHTGSWVRLTSSPKLMKFTKLTFFMLINGHKDQDYVPISEDHIILWARLIQAHICSLKYGQFSCETYNEALIFYNLIFQSHMGGYIFSTRGHNPIDKL